MPFVINEDKLLYTAIYAEGFNKTKPQCVVAIAVYMLLLLLLVLPLIGIAFVISLGIFLWVFAVILLVLVIGISFYQPRKPNHVSLEKPKDKL